MAHRRIGKIARLPAAIREEVNEFLNDGLEYPRIIDWLLQQGHSVSPMNLTNWKDGGYQDWLQHRIRLDELELKLEYASELAAKADAGKFQQATLNLTCLQFYEMLNRFDPAALSASLHARPEKYPAVINSLARFTREYVGLQRFRVELDDKAKAEAQLKQIDEGGLDNEGVARILRALRIRYPREFQSEISNIKSEITSPPDVPAPIPHTGN